MQRSHWRTYIGLAAAALVLGSAGCFNSPLWRFDRVDVQGEMLGSACSVTVDGEALPSSEVYGESTTVMIDAITNAGNPGGSSVDVLGCRGLIMMVQAPRDSLPRPGTYRVTTEPGFALGTIDAGLWSPVVETGLWPLALTGAYLKGFDGTVQLDSATREKAWGRFHIRARRQHKDL